MIKRLLSVLAVGVIMTVAVSAEAAQIDLAGISASATANGSWSDSTPDKAIDGDDFTQWAIAAYNNNWLLVDLGTFYDIDKIILKSYDNSNWPSSYYVNYDLLYSTDNISWTSAGTGTLYDDPNSYIDTVVFDGQTVQYLKFNVVGGTHWSHLREMEVYGAVHDASGSEVPEPATMLLFGAGIAGLAAVGRRQKK